jgi:TolB protein
MDSNGSNQIELPIAGAHLSPSPWSPDSRKIVYNTTHAENVLAIYDLNTLNLKSINLAGTPALDESSIDGTWSPDGSKIAFSCAALGSFDRGDICVVNSDGAQRVNLTADEIPDSGAPLWSPDGRKLLFLRRFESEGNYQLAVMNSNGAQIVQLTNIQSDAYLGGALWSPDSRKVAYFSGRMGSAADIYVVGVAE